MRQLDGSTRLHICADGVVIVLATNGIRSDEHPVSLRQRMSGFCCRGRAVIACLIGRRIYLIQLLTGFDFAALYEKPFQDDPVDLWANVRGPEGGDASRQLG